MDSNLWKLNERNASEFVKDLYLSLYNQESDQLTFNVDGEAFDAAEVYAYGDSLSLYKGGVRWFAGVVVAGPRFGSPSAERHDYSVAGLWWYLENLVFQQVWRSGSGTLNKSHVILGRDIENNPVTCGAVIAEVLDHAIATGAPFTYSAPDLAALSAKPPSDEQVDLACSEVIRKMLRWHPDTVSWFDYSAPTPILHFTRRADADALQYSCTDGELAEEIDIMARHDMVRDGVIINYERTDTIDGERIPTLQQDIYPANTIPGFGTANLTINLAGLQLATQSIKVVVEELGDYTKEPFWIDHFPELAGKTDLNAKTGTASAPPFGSVLVEGNVPEWTNKETATVEFAVQLSWAEESGTEVKNADFSLSLVTTNAETRKYTQEISYTPAEAYPIGLAEALYNALSVLHWQGRFQLVESEVSGGIHPGKVLNLAGGLAAWASMRAVMQSVEFDLDTGRTVIDFGPPEHLGPQDHIALLNANRSRITQYSGDSRKTGTGGGGGDVTGGGAAPNSSGSSLPNYSKLVLDNGKEGEDSRKVTIDPSTIAAGKTLTVKADGKDTEWGPGLPVTTEVALAVFDPTSGDDGAWVALAKGTDTQLLGSTGAAIEWQDPVTELPNCAVGALLVGDGLNSWGVYGIGEDSAADGYVLENNGSRPQWTAPKLPPGSEDQLLKHGTTGWQSVSLGTAIGLGVSDGVVTWDGSSFGIDTFLPTLYVDGNGYVKA